MQPTIITALATGDALGKPFENVKHIDRERYAWCHDPNGTFLRSFRCLGSATAAP